MLKLGKSLGRFLADTQKSKILREAVRRNTASPAAHGLSSSDLRETENFGSNPGALRMFSYLPHESSEGLPLVVVLHGCTQSAAGYDLGAGWSTLADRFGFALLLPEQQRANNPNGCFNWFQPGDIERGHGEALSIRQMVANMASSHRIDPARVFVTGLSAGGAMTSVMLATYPEAFAGGAIIAGLPYGAAGNVQQAFEAMFHCPPRSPRTWGDLVRRASPHSGPWPRLSVWHGGADATVIPSNADEILKQWTDVHGLPATPSVQTIVDGYPRQVWLDDAGEELIESYTLPQLAHGTPIATGAAHEQCGAAGPFLLEAGISSSFHIAKFFGLTAAGPRSVIPATREPVIIPPGLLDAEHRPPAAPLVLDGEILEPNNRKDPATAAPGSLDIGAVITRALRTAGLMKDG